MGTQESTDQRNCTSYTGKIPTSDSFYQHFQVGFKKKFETVAQSLLYDVKNLGAKSLFTCYSIPPYQKTAVMDN